MKHLILMAVLTGLMTGLTTTAEAKVSDEEVEKICKDFPFSTEEHPLWGCKVAAALDMSMPATYKGVAKRFKRWGERQQAYYLEKRLPKLTRWYTYLSYRWDIADRNAMFRKNHASYMSNKALGEYLRAPQSRLVGARNGRPRPRPSSRASSKKRTRLKVVQKKSGKRCTSKCPAP